MTIPTQLVLRALLADPAREMYGLQICAGAGLPSGTIHPILLLRILPMCCVLRSPRHRSPGP